MSAVLPPILGLLIATALAAAEPLAVTPAKTTELFNGRDLGGWVAVPADKPGAPPTWTVVNGMLRCRGTPRGYLRTTTPYAEYQVTVDWRFLKPGNTGLVVHITGEDKVWPNSIECQGMHDHQGDFYFWSGATAAGTTQIKNGFTLKMQGKGAEKPVGEWNTFRVVCRQDTLAIVVNGTETNRVAGCSARSGTFGIQSEGAEVEIRSVTVGPLTP